MASVSIGEEGFATAIATFKRHERKYLIKTEMRDEILPILLQHMRPDEYCTDGREYRIHSIYYDTVNHDVIRSNSQGMAYKEKMRVRSYYADNSPDAYVFMELKKKCKGIGNKRRIRLQNKEVAPFAEQGIPPQTDGYLSAQVVKELSYYLKMNRVAPAMYVQYDRLALFGKEDSDFRITFDRNIRVRRSCFTFGETPDDELLLPEDTCIMEIKILGAMPLWLSKMLSEKSIFSRGFSKYGVKYREDAKARRLTYVLEGIVNQSDNQTDSH